MSSAIALLVDLVVFGLLMYRQVSVRQVRSGRLPMVLAGLGLLEIASYGQHDRLAPVAMALLVASLVIGAALGAIRATTVRIWYQNGLLVRQGTWLTVLLWLVSVGIHLGTGELVSRPMQAVLSVGTLLYLGVTLGAQQLVIGVQARRMARTA